MIVFCIVNIHVSKLFEGVKIHMMNNKFQIPVRTPQTYAELAWLKNFETQSKQQQEEKDEQKVK